MSSAWKCCFVIYHNDSAIQSDAYLYVDYLKLFRIITEDTDRRRLQEDLHRVRDWCDQWEVKLHPEKTTTKTTKLVGWTVFILLIHLLFVIINDLL